MKENPKYVRTNAYHHLNLNATYDNLDDFISALCFYIEL